MSRHISSVLSRSMLKQSLGLMTRFLAFLESRYCSLKAPSSFSHPALLTLSVMFGFASGKQMFAHLVSAFLILVARLYAISFQMVDIQESSMYQTRPKAHSKKHNDVVVTTARKHVSVRLCVRLSCFLAVVTTMSSCFLEGHRCFRTCLVHKGFLEGRLPKSL